MPSDLFIEWLESEVATSRERIETIEVRGWRWLSGTGRDAMTDVTEKILAEAKERLAHAEKQLARLRETGQ